MQQSGRTWPSFFKTLARPTCRSRSASARTVCTFKIEHLAEAGVVDARRVVQPEFVAEPRIVAAENVAQPVEYEADRAGVQPVGERDQINRNRNPQVEFQRHGARLHQRVAGEQSYPLPRLDQHAVGEGVVAVMRDTSARYNLL